VAGISTIVLSSIPELTASVGVPRLAAIEHPLGYLVGRPDDQTGQMAVLRAVLQALGTIKTPGGIVHLPFEWPAEGKKLRTRPQKAPPITRYLLRHPWQIPNLFSRDVPGSRRVTAGQSLARWQSGLQPAPDGSEGRSQ
jgi:D-proline reductase (dithiol) PrdB